MRYLVTGGLGYVGSWVVRHLAQQGHDVFVTSRSTHKPHMGVPYTLIPLDLFSAEPCAIAELLPANLDGCFHAASCNEAFVPHYSKIALDSNAYGTRILLDALTAYKELHTLATAPLFIYCSTFHVYGVNEGIINEQTPVAPRSDYALSHFFAEEYCKMHGRVHEQPYIIVRLTNGYGAPVCAPFTKWYLLLNDLCKAAMKDNAITIRSNPNTLRNFIWLGDVATVIEKLFQRPDLSSQTFCLASDQTLSLREMAHLVAKAAQQYTGNPVALHWHSEATPVAPLILDAQHLCNTLDFSFSNRLSQEVTAIFGVLEHSNFEKD